MKYSFRDIEENDFELICCFPQNEDELFNMFPKAQYPLTAEKLKECAKERLEPTVFMYDSKIAGYANLYHIENEKLGFVGNVIVHPDYRNKGIGKYILEIMSLKLEEIYKAKEIHLSCFSDNTSALLLYEDYGFTPYKMERRINHKGQRIVLIHAKRNI
ncbi:GNAT family N-acetyltransferase [Dysgonomonas sp. 216]|uniref:GNAT family N-acetyltransferase n=1 Tax=Dysgonomonas sp. 216 TaxID=2302934 RepID=UPI0013D43E15|nr:GNAT family N-acetyltransferase [Dysgonomonas sp. 216]NDW19584.1 GNAT family N-acetyltransferase [Dysgonomonas sp. 216]